MISTANKTQSNKTQSNTPSSVTIKMKKAKLSSKFDMHKFLVKHHSEDNIHLFGAINGHWNWARQIRNSNVVNRDGLVILLGKDEQVLYIGHTNHIGYYIGMLKYNHNMSPTKIFIICNDNPSKLVYAVTAYRAKFKPVFNSERNTRFMFDNTSTVINLNARSEKVLDWIKRHPNTTRKEFLVVFNMYDLLVLCKCFNLKTQSYKDLKAKIFKTTSTIKVVSTEQLLNSY